MTIKTAVRISERRLLVKGIPVLEDVPDIVTLTPDADGVFLGAVLEEESNRHVIAIGTIRDARFLACFRFKLWWMAQRMGTCASQVPLETQFLLFETNEADGSMLYTLFLPLIESPFRACLQGSQANFLELCLESGDEAVRAASFTHAVLVHCGTDPFAVITEAVASARSHLNTFRTRHEKRLPAIVDLFGWCTWDAFYQEVTQEGVEEGIASLAAGGTPAKFLIIDDGWQSVKEHQKAMRLTGIKENEKFQDESDPTSGIKRVVESVKTKHGVGQVYVWHAITGYWGGVSPNVDGYDSTVTYPAISTGVVENEPTWKTDALALNGLGLVNPNNLHKFFNDVHDYLARAGVDGVKVDVQSILETLGKGLGGRVELTKKFHHALDASVARNFPTNGIIACMSHSSDALFCSRQTAVVRASDDFYPRDPMSHTIHIASVAYNSVFLGEFMLPDWDMFHSLHPAAEYHASARAISGGPVYVSDAPGKHDFSILRKLVLPNGSILRARLPGRPTLDCLFCDPARDGVSLLKIWNLNKYTGVVGVYNCQGAAWCNTAKKNSFHQTTTAAITGALKARDVHLIEETTDDAGWGGDCAVYSHHRRDVVFLPRNSVIPVSMKVLEHEIYTVTPVKEISGDVSFAPFGLIEMYNSGGAIMGLSYKETSVIMEVKGSGKFGAYSSAKPSACSVNNSNVEFDYDSYSGLVSCVLDDRPSHDVKIYW